MSVNKVFLLGNIGRDPELKVTPSGATMCTLSVATEDNFKKNDGSFERHVSWHHVVVWGKTAENCAKFLKKGQQVFIEGKLQNRSWEKDGQKHTVTDVIANIVQFCGRKDQKGESDGTLLAGGSPLSSPIAPLPKPAPNPQQEFNYEDIPF